MKYPFILLFSLFMPLLSSAQQTGKCARVKIHNVNFDQLSSSGFSFIHGQFSADNFFIGELCGQDLENLELSSLHYDILISDISDFYVNRDRSGGVARSKNIEYNCGPARNYLTPAHFSLGSMGGFYTFDEAVAQLDSMRALFPQLVSQKIQLGSSIENRPVYCVKISDNPDSNESEQQVLFTALHHAMEVASVQQLIFFMYFLLENYATDPEIHYLVDHLEIYFVPVVNPDGDAYNQQTNPNGGGTWRKNRRPNGLFTGVDLNRNYRYAFGYDEIGSSSLGFHPWYRGDSAFSEPETQAVRSLIRSKNFKLEMNWHSYGNYLIYPWNYNGDLTTDSVLYEQFSRYLTLQSHFQYGTCNQTYGYNSNGDADDYAYGNTTEKPAIISLTAELGSSADGFWPQSSNIEALCKQALDMNLRYIRLGAPFALANDLSSAFIQNTQGFIPVEVYCLGMDVPANFSVSLAALSPEITSVGAPVQFSNMATLEKRYDSISFTLNPGIVQGTPLNFLLTISNGTFSWSDTLFKTYCIPDTLLYDPANNMNNWNSSGYNVTTEQCTSVPSSFTESSGGNYSLQQSSSMELQNPVDLTSYDQAYLQFSARWQIEIAYDWVQALASTDGGSSWIPLCGKYSSYGTGSQQAGEPVYDGFFNDWVREEIPLNSFTGSQVKLKFTFNSNLTHQFNGMYMDDIRIIAFRNTGSLPDATLPSSDMITVDPNPAGDVIFVHARANADESIHIRLTDICGRFVCSRDVTSADGTISLDTRNLRDGLYLLNVTSDLGHHQALKIVIIH